MLCDGEQLELKQQIESRELGLCIMSVYRAEEFDYTSGEDDEDMANVGGEGVEQGNYYGSDAEEFFNDNNMKPRKHDTSAAQARAGRDIQGILWDTLSITREDYRRTSLEHYKNYENVSFSGERIDKEFKQMEKGSTYYEFQLNTKLVRPTVLHF